jgi:hypothetical protein
MSIAVILSAPNPSLVARLLGHILSNISPNIPLRLPATGAAVFLTGLLVGDDEPPYLLPFFDGLVPVMLFLPAGNVDDVLPILEVGD